MTARTVALQLHALLGTPDADWLLAAAMLDSWESLQRAVVGLAERDPFVVDALKMIARAS